MNSRSIIYSTLFPIAVLIGGCGQDQQEAAAFRADQATRDALIEKRAAYFRKHEEERLAARTICQSTPKDKRDEEMERECMAVLLGQ